MRRILMALATPLLLMAALPAEEVFEESGPVEIEVLVSPQTILLSSRAKGPQKVEVTVHAEIEYSDVATYTVKLADIEALFTFADARGDLVAKFELDWVVDEVQDMLEVGWAVLTLEGETKDGEAFSGQDTVRVIEGR